MIKPRDKKKTVYAIVGPTAGGKSALALLVAKYISGEIINADSMQIYQDLQLLTASPSAEEKAALPHHLYNFLDCHATYNAAAWVSAAAQKIREIEHPVLVGGTGLYLSSLINGISQIPDIDAAVRERVRQMPIEAVQAQVTNAPFSDPQRLRRALEVQLSTGKPLSYFQKLPPKKPLKDVDYKVIFVNPPREIIRQRCAERFHKMLDLNVIDEVKNLMDLHPSGSILKAIGVSEIKSYLDGKTTKNQMITDAITATRQYAKRQVTWFKHQLTSDLILQDVNDFSPEFLLSSSGT